MLDFTTIVLETDRGTCFTISEVTKVPSTAATVEMTVHYAYFDYLMKNGSANGAYAATALLVCVERDSVSNITDREMRCTSFNTGNQTGSGFTCGVMAAHTSNRILVSTTSSFSTNSFQYQRLYARGSPRIMAKALATPMLAY